MEDQTPRTLLVIRAEILQSLNGCKLADALEVLDNCKSIVESNCRFDYEKAFAEAKLRD